MSGRVGELSAKQAASLAQFRDRIGDILPELPAQHDHYLLRWLRARSFNVPKAEVMIRKHLDFRRNMKADTIISDWTPPEVITRYVSGGMCGYDKEGNPIWYDLVGPLDPKGLLMSASKQDFLRTKMRNMEMLQRECEKQSEKLGVNVEAITLIYDCEGLGFKHMWKPAIETYGEILTMFEDNYPEGLKRVFLIKAPKLFPMAYNLIKRFLCEETRRKLTVVGSKAVGPKTAPRAYLVGAHCSRVSRQLAGSTSSARGRRAASGGVRWDPHGPGRRSSLQNNDQLRRHGAAVVLHPELNQGPVRHHGEHRPRRRLAAGRPRERPLQPAEVRGVANIKVVNGLASQSPAFISGLSARISSPPPAGGSSPATGRTLASGCSDAWGRAASRRWPTCWRCFPANATTRTWCPRTT
nr:SEC14-like protein 2 isoform X3 [Syngnathus scovelli]